MLELVLCILVVAFLALSLGIVSLNVSTTVNGEYTAGASRDLTAESGVKANPTVLAALAGTLTTRTSDTVGTITLATGHGVSTADKVDLYWTGGKRYGVVVGTATATTIPISGGTGDILPAADSVINVGKINEAQFPVEGDDIQFLVLTTGVAGYIKLVEHNGTARTVHLVQYVEPGNSYIWDVSNGLTNPVAADTITHAHFSQSDTTSTTDSMLAGAGIN